MKHTKRILSIFLATLLIMLSVPVTFAEGDDIVWKEIYTYEDLDDVRYDLTANYRLMNDIDMTEQVKYGGEYDYYGQGWNPIGSRDIYADDSFSGIFDGNGHTISGIRMSVTKFPSGTGNKLYCGLFANVSGTVQNLTTSGRISVNSPYTNYAGGITAKLSEGGVISHCTNLVCISATGKVKDENNTYQYVGGIVGYADGVVQYCRNAADILTNSDCYYHVGYQGGYYYNYCYAYTAGIVGYGNKNCQRTDYCVNSGKITAKHTYDKGAKSYASGIVTYSKEVSFCYNTGEITEKDEYNAGISFDSNSVICCYNIGNIPLNSYYGSRYAIGKNECNMCYYLQGAGSSSKGASERTDAQMRRQITFQNWDFDTIWTMEGRDDYFYPELREVPLVLLDDFKTSISGTVKIEGEQEADSVLTANINDLTPEDATVTYSWKLDNNLVSTTMNYQIQEEDIGKTLTLTITGTGDFKGTLTASCVLGAPHEHTEEIIPAVPATCTETGLTEGLKCSECGEILTAQEEVPAKGHTPVTAGSSAASCIVDGFTGITYCSVCNAALNRGEDIPATGTHIPAEAVEAIILPATCGKDGVKLIVTKCVSCGETLSANAEVIPATGAHSTELRNQKDASCTKEGYTGDQYCTVCKQTISTGATIGKTAHTLTTINHRDATYDAEGYTGDQYCTVCKQTISTGTIIPKLVRSEPQPQPSGGCKWCGQNHGGAFGWLVRIFHNLFAAIFGARY